MADTLTGNDPADLRAASAHDRRHGSTLTAESVFHVPDMPSIEREARRSAGNARKGRGSGLPDGTPAASQQPQLFPDNGRWKNSSENKKAHITLGGGWRGYCAKTVTQCYPDISASSGESSW